MRTDTHRPSAINPVEYEYVLSLYYGSDIDLMFAYSDNHIKFSEMEKSGFLTKDDNWKGWTCSCCGHKIVYSGIYRHIPTNKAVQFGRDCAENINLGDINTFRRDIDSRKDRKGYATLANRLNDMELLGAELVRVALSNQGMTDFAAIASSASLFGLASAIEYAGNDRSVIALKTRIIESYYTFRSIIEKGAKYGLSDAQAKFIVKLVEVMGQNFRGKIEEIETAKANAQDLISGRYTTEATILSLKSQETQYGWTVKCLIELAGGAKAWGTLPSGAASAEKGTKLSITASFCVSDNDPKFGFFSRPKATII